MEDSKEKGEEEADGDSKPTQKTDSLESTRRLRRKSLSDELSEEKRSKTASEESVVSPEPKKRLSKTEKIKSFAGKGAAATHMATDSAATIRRKKKSEVLKSMIQPDDEVQSTQLSGTTATTRQNPNQTVALSEKFRRRETEMLHEQMLKHEQEDHLLASFVLDIVKQRRKERASVAGIELTEAQIFKRSRNMSAVEQAGIISVLEETVAKISVLGYIHGKPIVKPEIKYTSLLDKLVKKEKSAWIGLVKSHKTPEEYETEQQFIKLQKDRGFLEEALTLTLLEMRQKGTFKILQDIVYLEEEMVNEEADLRFKAKIRQQEVKHCKALMECERRKGKKKLDDRTIILAKLKDEIQNVIYYNGLKFKYTDHWEGSRSQQNSMLLHNKEKVLLTKLSHFEELSNIESRCSAELKSFIEQSIENLTHKVEEWMDRYEAEMEEREYKLNKLKEEREDHSKALQEKIELFNERQKQMDEWKDYKEKKRIEAEYRAYLNKMATLIQAWWRGTMVRNHLGPYRKKKGRKGKKKK